MSEPARRKWDLSDPQTLLAIVGVGATVVMGLFGAAFAIPGGQDLLCRTIGWSCDAIDLSDVRFTAWAVEHDRFCADQSAGAWYGEAPSIGSDCIVDFGTDLPQGYSGPMAYVESTPAVSLAGHLTFQHPQIARAARVTVRPDCWRGREGKDFLEPIPCALSPPRVGGDLLFGALAAEERKALSAGDTNAPNAIALTLDPAQTVFAARYRLDVDGQESAALVPGYYRMDLSIGAPGEAVEPAKARLEFEVRSPPEQ
jgi:hypothetical protein